MTEREQLTNEIYDILIASGGLTEEVKQRIVIAMDGYEFKRHEPVAPDGDYCGACGAVIFPDDNYCSNCGREIMNK